MELTNTFTVDSPIDVVWPVLCDIERIAPCMPGAQLQEVEGDVFRGEVKLKVGPINTRFKGTAQMDERDDDAHRAVLKASGKDTGGKGNANATITATAQVDGNGTKVTITTDLSITGKVAQFGRGALDDISTKLLGQFVSCLETKVLTGGSADDPDHLDDGAGGEGVGAKGGGAKGAGAEGGGPAPTAGGVDTSAGSDGLVAPTTSTAGTASPAAGGTGGPVGTAPAPDPGGMPSGTAATGGAAAAGTAGSGVGAGAGAPDSGARRIDSPEAEPIDLLDTAGSTVVKQAAAPVAGVMAIFFLLWWWRRRR